MELVTISPNWFLRFIVFPDSNDFNAFRCSQMLSSFRAYSQVYTLKDAGEVLAF